MSTFLQLLISGLVSGAIFSIYATGITLLYSTTGIYNFAFGAMAFCVALCYFQLVEGVGLPVWLSFVISILVLAPGIGLVLERVVFRQLARGSETARMVGSVGLVVALPALGFFIVERLIDNFGVELASLEYVALVRGLGPVPAETVTLFGTVTVNSNQLIVLATAFVAAVGLWLLVAHTRLGLNMRAVVDRRELASLRGVNPASTSRVAWMLGTLLAGLAGVISGPLFGLSGVTVLQFVVVSSAVVVLARFRSLPVSFFGGLALGAVMNLIAGYARRIDPVADLLNRVPGLEGSTVYLLLFFGLFFLGHQRTRVAGVAAEERRPADYMDDLSPWRRVLPWAIAGGVLVVWAFGLVPIDRFQAGAVEQTLIASGLAISFVYLSFTVVTGLGGMVSLAQATFTTAGALTAGYVANQGVLGGSFPIAVLLGALVAMALGALVAIPAMRLGGVALALATLALAFIGETILFRLDFANNDSRGWILERPKLGPLDFDDDRTYIALLMVLLAIGIWVVRNLEHSLTGRAVFAVRNGAAAASVGISAARVKVTVFAISGMLAGIGGALLSYNDKAANDAKYPATIGLLWLTIAVTWGVRRREAAVLAGMIGVLMPRVLQTGALFIPGTDTVHIPAILFGLGAVQLARSPDGILALVAMENRARRNHRRQRRTHVPDDGQVAPGAVVTATERVDVTPAPVGVEENTLVVSGLHAGYGDVEVLHGVDLVVPPNSLVALVGANGAGKSTLCAALAGSLPATSGSVWFDARDVTGAMAHARASSGLVLSPESRGVFPALTVEDNLDLWLPSVEDRERALDRFPLIAERRRLPAGNLSGGEQQILALAPLLVRPPKLLVVDEPTLGLAPMIVDQLVGIFNELRDEGTALLLVEEKLSAVDEIAQHIAIIRLGRITWSGPPNELDRERLNSYYLGGDMPEDAVSSDSGGRNHSEL